MTICGTACGFSHGDSASVGKSWCSAPTVGVDGEVLALVSSPVLDNDVLLSARLAHPVGHAIGNFNEDWDLGCCLVTTSVSSVWNHHVDVEVVVWFSATWWNLLPVLPVDGEDSRMVIMRSDFIKES